MSNKNVRLSPKEKLWLDAQKKYHLSNKHVQMARELGLNPNKLGKLANNKQEKWKAPLPIFIESIYEKRFKRESPEKVSSIIESAKERKKRKALSKEKNLERKAERKRLRETINKDLNIRSINQNDIKPLCDFLVKNNIINNDYKDNNVEYLIKINTNGNHLIIAELNNEIVGLMMFHCWFDLQTNRMSILLTQLYVIESMRMLGIGRKLCLFLTEYANENHIKNILLISQKTTKGMKALLKKLGFNMSNSGIFKKV